MATIKGLIILYNVVRVPAGPWALVCNGVSREADIKSRGVTINLMMKDPIVSMKNKNQTSMHAVTISTCYEVAFCSPFSFKYRLSK